MRKFLLTFGPGFLPAGQRNVFSKLGSDDFIYIRSNINQATDLSKIFDEVFFDYLTQSEV